MANIQEIFIPYKRWIKWEASRLGASDGAIYNRVWRGGYKDLEMKRLNNRLVFVKVPWDEEELRREGYWTYDDQVALEDYIKHESSRTGKTRKQIYMLLWRNGLQNTIKEIRSGLR